MMTKDKEFNGRVDGFETDFKTRDYKIVVNSGVGNFSKKLVYSACVQSTSGRVVNKDHNFYTTFQEAKLNMNTPMILAQRRIDTFSLEG